MDSWIALATREFETYRRMSEKAMAQIDDQAFFAAPGPETNSVAILVKHMAGNLRSRWTHFLTTDGEKPDRNRDSEFELDEGDTRAALMTRWENGWKQVFETLGSLSDADLSRTVTIRWEAHTVQQAIQRQLTHAAYHTGQIVLLCRHFAREWRTLSIARGESDAFNARMQSQAGARSADPR